MNGKLTFRKFCRILQSRNLSRETRLFKGTLPNQLASKRSRSTSFTKIGLIMKSNGRMAKNRIYLSTKSESTTSSVNIMISLSF